MSGLEAPHSGPEMTEEAATPEEKLERMLRQAALLHARMKSSSSSFHNGKSTSKGAVHEADPSSLVLVETSESGSSRNGNALNGEEKEQEHPDESSMEEMLARAGKLVQQMRMVHDKQSKAEVYSPQPTSQSGYAHDTTHSILREVDKTVEHIPGSAADESNTHIDTPTLLREAETLLGHLRTSQDMSSTPLQPTRLSSHKIPLETTSSRSSSSSAKEVEQSRAQVAQAEKLTRLMQETLSNLANGKSDGLDKHNVALMNKSLASFHQDEPPTPASVAIRQPLGSDEVSSVGSGSALSTEVHSSVVTEPVRHVSRTLQVHRPPLPPPTSPPSRTKGDANVALPNGRHSHVTPSPSSSSTSPKKLDKAARNTKKPIVPSVEVSHTDPDFVPVADYVPPKYDPDGPPPKLEFREGDDVLAMADLATRSGKVRWEKVENAAAGDEDYAPIRDYSHLSPRKSRSLSLDGGMSLRSHCHHAIARKRRIMRLVGIVVVASVVVGLISAWFGKSWFWEEHDKEVPAASLHETGTPVLQRHLQEKRTKRAETKRAKEKLEEKKRAKEKAEEERRKKQDEAKRSKEKLEEEKRAKEKAEEERRKKQEEVRRAKEKLEEEKVAKEKAEGEKRKKQDEAKRAKAEAEKHATERVQKEMLGKDKMEGKGAKVKTEAIHVDRKADKASNNSVDSIKQEERVSKTQNDQVDASATEKMKSHSEKVSLSTKTISRELQVHETTRMEVSVLVAAVVGTAFQMVASFARNELLPRARLTTETIRARIGVFCKDDFAQWTGQWKDITSKILTALPGRRH